MQPRRERNAAIVNRYIASGLPWPCEPSRIAEWAINIGIWKPQSETLVKQAVDEFTDAMRNEYITDPQGRRVRVKHAARVKREGKQVTLWGDWNSDPLFMAISYAQRRRLIVGEAYQLKLDVDSYNQNANAGRQIAMSFNFESDIAEKEAIRVMEQMKATGSQALSRN